MGHSCIKIIVLSSLRKKILKATIKYSMHKAKQDAISYIKENRRGEKS